MQQYRQQNPRRVILLISRCTCSPARSGHHHLLPVALDYFPQSTRDSTSPYKGAPRQQAVYLMQWKSAAKQSQTCIPQRSEVSGEVTAYTCLQLVPGNTDHAYSLVIFWSTYLKFWARISTRNLRVTTSLLIVHRTLLSKWQSSTTAYPSLWTTVVLLFIITSALCCVVSPAVPDQFRHLTQSWFHKR